MPIIIIILQMAAEPTSNKIRLRRQAIDRWKAHVNPDADRLKKNNYPTQHHRLNSMINNEYVSDEADAPAELFTRFDLPALDEGMAK